MLFTNSLVFAEFGFNTNLLETNVLNLSVVVAVVVIYIGDALKSLLANRKQTILNKWKIVTNQRTISKTPRGTFWKTQHFKTNVKHFEN